MKLSSTYYLIFLLGICLLLFFSNLDVIYVNIMEARNFISAREMLTHNHWIHTTLSLEPRYEKPPLPTWLTAISASIFGLDSLVGLRLPAAMAATLMIISSYLVSLKIIADKRHAFVNALVLASSFFVVFSGRNGQWDIFCHAFMLFAIYKLLQAFETSKPRWRYWLTAGLFMGLSFMSKGPVSFYALLFPFLIAYGIIYKFRFFKKKRLPLLAAILIFAGVGLTWGLYIYLTNPGVAKAIADKETLAWAERNVRPWYYYWSFFTQSGIWTFFAFIGLLYPFIINRIPYKKAYRFTILWTLIGVVLLSIIPEKKSRYLLPILIPLALNTGFVFNYLIQQGRKLKYPEIIIPNVGFGLIAFICLAFPIGGYLYFNGELEGYWTPYILTSIFLICIGGIIIWQLWKKNYKIVFYTTSFMLPGLMLLGFPMAPLFYGNDQFNSTAILRTLPQLQEIPIYGHEVTPELIWELGEPLQVINDLSQLPDEQTSFAILVNQELPATFLNEHQLQFVTKFDLNYVNKGKKGYKNRLTSRLYVKYPNP
ncbi:glycosyltransferase family 39 protein [Flavobacteriaceae bacterium F08102]|nr:glycosyltransferase family 39 protein [Flavobacteriaceae bacterium F08102]